MEFRVPILMVYGQRGQAEWGVKEREDAVRRLLELDVATGFPPDIEKDGLEVSHYS
jgi:hypothetical protein